MPTENEKPSARELVRRESEKVLRASDAPLHFSAIAAVVLPALGLSGRYKPKDLNNALHEDPLRRFESRGMGIWVLSPTPRGKDKSRTRLAW